MEDKVMQLQSKLLQSWQEIENLELKLSQAYSEKLLMHSELNEWKKQLDELQEVTKSAENRVQAWMKIALESQQETHKIKQQLHQEREQLKSQAQIWMKVALEAQEEVKQLKQQPHQIKS